MFQSDPDQLALGERSRAGVLEERVEVVNGINVSGGGTGCHNGRSDSHCQADGRAGEADALIMSYGSLPVNTTAVMTTWQVARGAYWKYRS
jgi:hypothetical protein